MAVLVAVRLVLVALVAACVWLAYQILYEGPSGSGSAMAAAVRFLHWAAGLGVFFFACLLLTFCSWRRGRRRPS